VIGLVGALHDIKISVRVYIGEHQGGGGIIGATVDRGCGLEAIPNLIFVVSIIYK